jgi:hypothetical protein
MGLPVNCAAGTVSGKLVKLDGFKKSSYGEPKLAKTKPKRKIPSSSGG